MDTLYTSINIKQSVVSIVLTLNADKILAVVLKKVQQIKKNDNVPIEIRVEYL